MSCSAGTFRASSASRRPPPLWSCWKSLPHSWAVSRSCRIYNGLIIGAQGGNERSFGIVDKSLEHGIKVSGLWCQDWCGKRVTSFGKRLQWDWHYHKEMYPDLPKHIEELHARGIKFLGYVNPYLVNDGELYAEGKKLGVFAKKADGSDYLVDFGEFYCGVVDFTNPEAFRWFKDEVIKKYTLDIGIDGWMADFGEYLPKFKKVLPHDYDKMLRLIAQMEEKGEDSEQAQMEAFYAMKNAK